MDYFNISKTTWTINYMLVKLNLSRSQFSFIVCVCVGGGLGGGRGVSKLLKSNLPRSHLPFISGGGVKVEHANFLTFYLKNSNHCLVISI